MNELTTAVEYLKLRPTGKLNNPQVLEQLSNKLGINSNFTFRNKAIKRFGKVWIKKVQDAIINQAVIEKQKQTIKEEKQLNRVLGKVNLSSKPKIKLTDRVGQFEKYQVQIYNPENDLAVLHNALMEVIAEKDFTTAFLNLIFKKKGSNRLRFVSVQPFIYTDFRKLEDYIEELNRGEVVGTDAVETIDYDLIYNVFGISSFSAEGFGDMRYIFWEIEDEIKKGNCAVNCLELCGFKTTEKIKDLAVLNKIITDNKLKIRVVKNNPSFDYNTFKTSTNTSNFVIEEAIYFNKKKVEIKKAYVKNNFKYEYQVIQDCDDFKYTIIFCENGKHFSVAKNNTMTLKANVFIDLYNKTLGNDEVGLLYKFQQFNFCNITKPKTIKGVELEYVFFDLETIIDWNYSNCMKPYSLSICCLNAVELEQLEKYDKENNKVACERMRNKHAKTWIGYDCVIKFLEWVIDNQASKKFKFIGFNNANFDNYFILQELMNGFGVGDLFIELKESNLFFSGSSLMNFSINGRHSFFDLKKHLVGSLDSNCKSWGVNCCSKLSFNHNHAQNLYDEAPEKLIEYCLNDETLKKYNEFDTISVAVILQKYKNELNGIDCVKAVIDKLGEGKNLLHNQGVNDITNVGTIGSLIYKVFQNECEMNDIKFDKLDLFKYNELQRCKIAGRVEMFNGVQHIKERCASTDVCSLYPYVLAVKDVYYPHGEVIEVNEFQGFDTIGFYWVSFNQEDLESKNLPSIYALKTGIRNEWDYKGEIKQYLLSNVILQLFQDYGVAYTLDSPVHYAGFVFSEKSKSCEMFRFLLEIMKKKNEQDGYKTTAKHLYNSALRETLKLLMNAISGKVIEGLHTEQTSILNSEELAQMFSQVSLTEEQSDKEHQLQSINMINVYGGKLVVQYEYWEKYKLAEQRPIYLGVLLYDYAKDYMYRTSYSKLGKDKLLYTDTDASKMRYNDFIEWRKYAETTIVPHWEEVEEYDDRYKTHTLYNPNSKVFGSFEDELEDYIGNDYEFFCLEKKCWLYKYDDNCKYRFKGINDRSMEIDMTDPPVWVDTIKRTNKQTGEKEIGYCVNDEYSLEINNYIEKHKDKQLKGLNAYKLFYKLHTEKSAYVLTSSFKKVVNNSTQAINEDGEIIYNNLNHLSHQIQMNFMLKKIQL